MMREQHQRLTEFDWQQDHVDDEQSALQTESRFQADLESHLGVNANATSTYRRFANSSDSAWKIVDGLGYERRALLQLELVHSGKKLEETTAGMCTPEE